MTTKHKNLNILVVDDKEDDYLLICRHLRSAFPNGVTTTLAGSYEQALEVTQKQQFDIYLLDYLLGPHDGLELANTLNPRNPETPPIIILTGMNSRDVEILALQGGVADCLFKDQLTPPLLERAIYYALARKESDIALRESEIRHRTLLNTLTEGIVTINSHGEITSVNPAVSDMFGYEENELVGENVEILMPGPYHSEHGDYLNRYKRTNEAHLLDSTRELPGKHKNGDVFPLEIKITEFEVGDSKFFCGVLNDISKRKQEEEDLRLAARTFEVHAAIMITDGNGTIVRVNNAFTRITGYSAAEAVGNNPRILQSGIQSPEFYKEMWSVINEEGQWEGELWNKRKNGEHYPEWLTITAVTTLLGEVSHYIATFQDITERKEAEAVIEHQAFYDALTDLPNRRFLLDRLHQELASARRRDTYGAVLFMDLDHFKTLNDSLGHAAGDYLLQQVSKRLVATVRAEDTVVRLGGDEFVVLLPHLHNEAETSGLLANNIAEKIRLAIAAPYEIQGCRYKFSSSIGIAMFPFDNESVDDVMKHADTAMYQAKANNRNTIRFYRPTMQVMADTRLMIEMELSQAVEHDELVLHYQPLINRSEQIIGVEALIRWNHPRQGQLLPDDFIGIAEQTSLIIPIGEWVLRTAMQQFMSWKAKGYISEFEYVAVNVSPLQFQRSEFVSTVKNIIKETGMQANQLKIEITEVLFLQDINETIEKMMLLKKMGVMFSIDDFGKGYSSLSYLKQLPLDQIKIDKSFVKDVAVDKKDAAMVKTIIAMARHFNLDVLAEGVETKEALDYLRANDCEQYQGFYFSQSLDEEHLLQYLQASHQFSVEAGSGK